MSTETIYGMSDRDLEKALIGKSIVATTGESITVCDGTVLHIEDTSDCCAWYEGAVRTIDLGDNVVTSVVASDSEVDSDAVDAYTLTVLSGSAPLLGVDIQGDPTSGYYCHSVNLRVVKPDA